MLSRLKWLVSGAVLAALAIAGGGWLLRFDHERSESLRAEHERLTREHEALVQRAKQLEREREELAHIVERFKLERRVAEVEVLEQHTALDGVVLQTVIRLTEIGRDGTLLPAQVFGVAGRVPHFDALVIKFDEDYVGRGDPLRGTSLALFRRVYGETQSPESGYWLGRRGEVPDVYRVSAEPSEFEVSLWREFWSYAADPAKARDAGVRVAQGEAVYAPMSPGERWLLTLEADGGLNLIKHGDQTAGTAPVAPPSSGRPKVTPGENVQRLSAPSPLKEDL